MKGDIMTDIKTLLKGAEQLMYRSPIYDNVYDEDDNVVDEHCVREGTDVIAEFIIPTHEDGKPRYYRLRYPVHAKEHKRRWQEWLEGSQSMTKTPFKVKATKIGRRVLFSIDKKFEEKLEKKTRRFKSRLLKQFKVEVLDGLYSQADLDKWMNERNNNG